MSEVNPEQLYEDAVRDLTRSNAREYFIDPTLANDGEIPANVMMAMFAMGAEDWNALVGLTAATVCEAAGILAARNLLAKRLAAVEGKLERAEAQLRDQQNVHFAGKKSVPWVDVPLPGME